MAAYKNPDPSVDDEIKENNEENKISSEDDYSYREDVYFAFIDVLGFKKTFDDHKINEKHDDVGKFRDVFNYYFELMNSAKFMIGQSRTKCYAGQTSDSLYFYTPRSDMLIEFIKVFLHFNLYAMSQGVFFRGGIAKGNLFIRESYQFYGESVIFAYLLESSIAKYPVTIIDENTYQAIKDFNLPNDLVKNQSGRYYLNIFAFEKEDVKMAFDEDSYFEMKEINYEFILDNIKKNKILFEYDVKNYEKYTFLLKEYEEYMNSLNKDE